MAQTDLPDELEGEEIDTEIDPRYCTPLLSPEERQQLVETVNGPDEQSEDEDNQENP
ncbi:MAG TPA: hypothetical protein VMA75_03700 [Candidatus Paceibacterota bacterium]|nr:hypothetical protein [Candidatus Paceibacterota bacterium]